MKFEDLKLPEWENSNYQVVATNAARAIYDQMHAHYEAKLAEAKPEPEELFQHPDMPWKKFRRLKVGEMRERTDFACSMNPNSTWVPCATYGYVVGEDEACHYYREVSQPAPAWRLPDPPPGQQWHRTDWTQEMLPEGYRPLLLGETCNANDFFFDCFDREWRVSCAGSVGDAVQAHWAHTRTRRPLPEPVEYVPLGPEDVPPGSVVRTIGAEWWKQVTGVSAENITVCAAGNLSWRALADNGWEILRPGSKTWEPCKKPKA